ncbi:phenylacetate--CoA ligase family protein [Ectothiorhodospira sp. PHS-1]|uniref:phenylacetate--CoA ligase family protein n=1 Tax=Ectothiorhodospira sp. PHS-1 TaxID=519989 RepID=UPI00058E690F|nr:phenylacetate--CoA ligase family protein [Ectothiorhodospira sp. PHS-1]
MHEGFVRSVVFPLHERLRGRSTAACYASLRGSERLSPDALKALQDRKLQRLMTHCWHHVPFYRRRFEALGVSHPEELGREVLTRLPLLERADVREYLDDLTADDHRDRLIRHTTGGSTGQPLVFYTDPLKESWHNAAKLRGRAWFGIEPGSRQVDYWGSPVELSKQDALRRFKDRRFLNQVVISGLDLRDEALARGAEQLRRFRPRLVYGYPTVLYHVALYMERYPQAFGGWRPELVTCTSEVLYPNQRDKMLEVFQCPVGNEYGSRDGGHLAHECPAGRLHIAAEHVLLEVDEPDAQGVGDLVVTNLDGHGMPLLRYRLGDRVALEAEPCPCGLTLPTLGQVMGRMTDFIVARDGSLIHSAALVGILRELPDLKQFRIIQRRDLSIEILLVRDAPFPQALLDEVCRRMQGMMGTDLPVTFSFPDHIPPGKSGKYATLISEAYAARP